VREQAEFIMHHRTRQDLSIFGGYPMQWDVRNVDGKECIVIASLEGSDHNEPCLEIIPVSEFVTKNLDEMLFDLHIQDRD
jgi:hypothetical protein